MSRIPRLGVSGALICLAFSPLARAAATTQPTIERSPRVQGGTLTILPSTEKALEKVYGGPVTARVEVQVPRQTWPYLRVGPPTLNVAQGWVLKNQNSNTWHYIVPVGSDF
jgi:hypothetical protein